MWGWRRGQGGNVANLGQQMLADYLWPQTIDGMDHYAHEDLDRWLDERHPPAIPGLWELVAVRWSGAAQANHRVPHFFAWTYLTTLRPVLNALAEDRLVDLLPYRCGSGQIVRPSTKRRPFAGWVEDELLVLPWEYLLLLGATETAPRTWTRCADSGTVEEVLRIRSLDDGAEIVEFSSSLLRELLTEDRAALVRHQSVDTLSDGPYLSQHPIVPWAGAAGWRRSGAFPDFPGAGGYDQVLVLDVVADETV